MASLHNVRSVKSQSEPDLLRRSGVTGVSVGRKISKGKITDELSIRVYVAKKKKTVTESECIPPEINRRQNRCHRAHLRTPYGANAGRGACETGG